MFSHKNSIELVVSISDTDNSATYQLSLIKQSFASGGASYPQKTCNLTELAIKDWMKELSSKVTEFIGKNHTITRFDIKICADANMFMEVYTIMNANQKIALDFFERQKSVILKQIKEVQENPSHQRTSCCIIA